jgi:excisionase family DNA binding protein
VKDRRTEVRGRRSAVRRERRAGSGQVVVLPAGFVGGGGEPFVTKEEVAKGMRKSVRAVEAWMREGCIPFYRLGQAVRFRWSEVQAHFAARHRVAAVGPEDSGQRTEDRGQRSEVGGQRSVISEQ